MKILRSLLLSSVIVAACLNVAEAGDFKVGVVNANALIIKSPQAEAARKKFDAEFAPRQKELLAQQKKVQDMETRLSREGDVMSEAERSKLESDIASRKRDLKNAADEFRDDQNIRQNEELGKLQRIFSQVVDKFAKQEKYDLILDAAIYASEQVDITDEVMQRLKSEYGAAGSAK